MGRSPCCSSDDANLKKGPWTPEEDEKLLDYINTHGHGNWKTLPKHAGLNRCGKSCRLRWANYLRPDIKRGRFSEEEERLIVNLHSTLGNKWSKIATYLPGRTDNEIKNFWNTHIRKKLLNMGLDPNTHKPRTDLNHLLNLTQLICAAHSALKVQADAAQLLQKLIQTLNTNQLSTITAGLMGSQKSYPYEGLINGTSSLYADEPAPVPQKFHSMSQGVIDNSWASFEGYESPDMSHKVNNSSSHTTLYIGVPLNFSSSSLFTIHIQVFSLFIFNDFLISELVSESPETATTSMNQMGDDKTNTNHYYSTMSPADTSMFQAWEKLMGDETDSSFWKDILDLTSSPSSPIQR
ncbi:hypothetical protein ES288_D08G202700v1 [Gossypium darwinii]|uniref:Uncharacterized protein n=1 Tax=Gossypium darwinii TaxID=34276 RepID=A0A5D2BLI4_GOSDA|nr:hypothetical protein ES288_D08G202700v1 [Gossypium darwinii]